MSEPARQPHADRRHLYLLPLAALIAILPLVVHGNSCGHDFDFHLLNWLEASSQWAHGNLYPTWAYTPAFNAGEPRFIFYPPLSWSLGALLGTVLPWSWVPVVYTWIALSAAGLALHHLARPYTSANAALLAATVYLANPYTLFTAFERSAFAELLAAAWIPLLLAAMLAWRPTIPRIALPIALLWLTNAPAAVMGCYALAILALLRLGSRKPRSTSAEGKAAGLPIRESLTRLQFARTILAGTMLGLGLAAFYIIPAAWERRFIQIDMAIIAGMRVQDNFLFHHTGTSPDALLHDQVLHTASMIAVFLVVATMMALGAPVVGKAWSGISRRASLRHEMDLRARWQPDSQLGFFLLILTLAIALLLTPATMLLWLHLPDLRFLQFPWRLLALQAALLGLAVGVVLGRHALNNLPTGFSVVALAALLSLPAYHAFKQSCEAADTVAARFALFHSNAGSEPTDEYTPLTADNDALGHRDPPFFLAAKKQADAADPQPAAGSKPGPAPARLTLDLPDAEVLTLNLRDYPMWLVTRDGLADLDRTPRDDGLLSVPLPAGRSVIEVRARHSLDQTLGWVVSGVALPLLVLVCMPGVGGRRDGGATIYHRASPWTHRYKPSSPPAPR